jgi:hypothetical protein
MHCFVAGWARKKQEECQSLVTYAQKARLFDVALVLERVFIYFSYLFFWMTGQRHTMTQHS